MAYKRRYGRRKRRKTYRRRRKTGSAYRMAKLALRRCAPEWKYTDGIPINNVDVPSAGAFADFTPTLATGTGPSDRIGNKVKYRRLQIRGHLAIPTSFPISAARCRVVVFIHKDSDAVTTVTSVLEAATTMAYRRIETSGKIKVIKDKLFTMGLNGGLSAERRINWSFRFNKELLYADTSSAQANNWRIQVLYMGDQGTYPLKLTLYARSRYTDS